MTPKTEIKRARMVGEAVRARGVAPAGALALLLWLLALAAPALAGPPAHPATPALDLDGKSKTVEPKEFNKACGTAVDSRGDVYVASAGLSTGPGSPTIDVFDPSHNHLATIANANEPCGLAVDSKGNLYVSEAKTGNVVKYVPSAYPFVGVPTYGAPVTVDASGEAKGIAADSVDDRLYVAKGSLIDVYKADGSQHLPTTEVQRVRIDATGGTYTLTFRGKTTAALAYNATSAQVDAALEALSTIGGGNVVVTEEPLLPGDTGSHKFTFAGALQEETLPRISGDVSKLTGGTFGFLFETLTQGFSGKIGENDLSQATGVAAYTSDGGDRYVFAADAASEEVKVFNGSGVDQIELRRSIDGSDDDGFKADQTPEDGFGFGPAGASLAADFSSGHFFLYDAEHEALEEFEATGEFVTQIESPGFEDAEPTAVAAFPQRNEVQRVNTSCSGGTFTLGFEAQTTTAIPCKATTAEVGAALEALATIGAGNVAVSGDTATYSIAFVEDLGNRDVEQLLADDSALTGFGEFATVTTEVQGLGPGRLFVSAGTGAVAKLLAFAPLAPPSRPALPEPLSFGLKSAGAIAVDRFGNRYVGAGASIGVYPPGSTEPLATIPNPGKPYDLAVDSECNVYALDANAGIQVETAVYFAPDSCPPKPGTKYSGPTTVATTGPPHFKAKGELLGMGLDPDSDRVYVIQRATGIGTTMLLLESAQKGSGTVNQDWTLGLATQEERDIDFCAASGNAYVAGTSSGGTVIYVIDPTGTEILARITGKGSHRGVLLKRAEFAVNQANCHVVAFQGGRGVAEEYEASGAFLAEVGSFSKADLVSSKVAIDSSGGPNTGVAYVAFDDPENKAHPFDLAAFGPLTYGEVPEAVTGIATGVGGGEATLNGTLDPRGFEVEECRFQYTTEADFQANGFSAAEEASCAESSEEIGKGSKAVAVHAELTGLDPAGRYRFRLVASNKFGPGEGEAGTFGPPLASTKPAKPISYVEATLRAIVDPSGLATEYHFEYGQSEAYGEATEALALPAAAGPTEIAVPVFGLSEGSVHHFRVVAENEVKASAGDDLSFQTLEREERLPCPNDAFRTGPSANLPDCRAYELVTPAETRGLAPEAANSTTHQFSNWLVAPEGERLSFFTTGSLPGFDGNGIGDGYRARRAPGAHPSGGWGSELFSPSYADAAASFDAAPVQEGIAADQEYSFWTIPPVEKGTLAAGTYLRIPTGFEALGQGSLGTDPNAFSDYVSPAGAHVIFSSKAQLEPEAAPAGTNAIYDRTAGSASAEVVSIKPDGSPFGAGENAIYAAASEDGQAIAFKVGGALYLRHGGQTLQVAAGPNAFAGISEDGERVFYTDAAVSGDSPAPAGLWLCDLSAGPCAGPDSHAPTEIAPSSRFIHVSAEGTHVYLTSTAVLDEGGEGTLGEDNLYLWEAASETTRFIATLDPEDLAAKGFQGLHDNLLRWIDAANGTVGRAISPTRSSAGGTVFAFESHANLTVYDAEGHSEVYRYDSGAALGEEIACVSCDPSGIAPQGDSVLQELRAGSTVEPTTLIPNLTEDGEQIFFVSEDPLLPGDANEVRDVYQWKAQGAGGCKRPQGCLALISSGQGEADSVLYAMTRDGKDVFFSTKEKLVGQDIAGSPSIYDARVQGGIPDPPAKEDCQGDSCQGAGAVPPTLVSPPSANLGEGGNVSSEAAKAQRCAKGKRKVRRAGKTRCVKRKARHKANRDRRAGR